MNRTEDIATAAIARIFVIFIFAFLSVFEIPRPNPRIFFVHNTIFLNPRQPLLV